MTTSAALNAISHANRASRIGGLMAAAACLALAGCMSVDVLHYDGVTTSAGDAIAANTVMQLVDPWQAGVEQTRFPTPAVRPKQSPGSGASSAAAPGANDY